MKLLFLSLALLLLASPRRVDHHTVCTGGWLQPPCYDFARASDPLTGEQLWVLVADNGDMCVVPALAWTVAQDGSLVDCQWRHRRGGR
jgi:hypothetical protein